MKIEKTLKITIKQADVELAIKELIKKEDPTIVVDTIAFQPKRTGTDSIAISVDAHFGDDTTESVEEEVVTEEPVEVVEETDDTPPFEADAPEEEEEVSGKTSLFN